MSTYGDYSSYMQAVTQYYSQPATAAPAYASKVHTETRLTLWTKNGLWTLNPSHASILISTFLVHVIYGEGPRQVADFMDFMEKNDFLHMISENRSKIIEQTRTHETNVSQRLWRHVFCHRCVAWESSKQLSFCLISNNDNHWFSNSSSCYCSSIIEWSCQLLF